jgi:glutamate--cysteine ligase catalytic subunit
MIEATPRSPFGSSGRDLAEVERNMRWRREHIRKHLRPNEEIISLPVFPRLGAVGFAADPTLHPAPDGLTSQSLFIPDASIQPHPRFPTLTANIRKRRGEKVMIAVPVFQDKNTATAMASQAAEVAMAGTSVEKLARKHIYMDAMAFGMGAGCLQVTLQASDVHEARTLYDQLAVMAPIMLALTAASPVWKGLLADTDARWNVISASVDDRTAAERGLAATTDIDTDHASDTPAQRIFKSRYSSIDCFIGESEMHLDEYNDLPVPVDELALQRLRAAEIDDRLARHVAHLFARDPLVVYHEKLEQDNAKVRMHDHIRTRSAALRPC